MNFFFLWINMFLEVLGKSPKPFEKHLAVIKMQRHLKRLLVIATANRTNVISLSWKRGEGPPRTHQISVRNENSAGVYPYFIVIQCAVQANWAAYSNPAIDWAASVWEDKNSLA